MNLSDTTALPDSHPAWFERCEPFYLLLREPKTRAELSAWCRARKLSPNVLSQLIAWCSNRNLIMFRDGKWAAKPPFVFPAAPKPPEPPKEVQALERKKPRKKKPDVEPKVVAIEVGRSPQAVVRQDDEKGSTQLCRTCWVWKPYEDFPKCARNQTGLKVNCRDCAKGAKNPYGDRNLRFLSEIKFDPKEPYKSPVWRTLVDLVASAHSESRALNVPCDLSCEWIFNQWAKQRGRCHVMGLPLEIKKGAFYPVLERLNRLVGYTQANTRIICQSAAAWLRHFEID